MSLMALLRWNSILCAEMQMLWQLIRGHKGTLDIVRASASGLKQLNLMEAHEAYITVSL